MNPFDHVKNLHTKKRSWEDFNDEEKTSFNVYNAPMIASKTINLGEIGLPQNEEITVIAQSFNSATYNDQPVYSNSPSSSITLIWGFYERNSDTTVIRGDSNIYGDIDVMDIVSITNLILGDDDNKLSKEQLLEADIDNDGDIDIIDAVLIINKIVEK